MAKIAITTAVAAVGLVAFAACGTDDNGSSALPTRSSPVAPAGEPMGAGKSEAASGLAASGLADSEFAAAGFTCHRGTLRSSGSTAQGKVMAALIASYNKRCDAEITVYGGGGSGRGFTDFLAGQTDFGGSDSGMDAEEQAAASRERCSGAEAINLPMVTGPIAVPYHLAGVDSLVLTPDVLAGIFGGTITQWNDPALAAINADVELPDLAITAVHRSEDSGTTDNFTRYLAAAGGWEFPGGKAWSAPGGVGAQGSDGVAKAVAGTAGAIGYVEWGYTQTDDLAIAQIDNGAGAVALTAQSAGRAVQAASVIGTGADLTLNLDYATQQPGAYPIILVTYEMVCTGGNGDAADLLRSFLGYSATDGQRLFVELGAAPLPDGIRTKVVDAVKALA